MNYHRSNDPFQFPIDALVQTLAEPNRKFEDAIVGQEDNHVAG
jgi:hypothetical protein